MRVPAHRLGVDRQPGLAVRRPSRSRSAGRRGSACRCSPGRTTKSRDSETACSTSRRGSGALRGRSASSSAQRSTYVGERAELRDRRARAAARRARPRPRTPRGPTARSAAPGAAARAASPGGAGRRAAAGRRRGRPSAGARGARAPTPRRGSRPSARPGGPTVVRTGTTRATKPCIIQPSVLSCHSSSRLVDAGRAAGRPRPPSRVRGGPCRGRRRGVAPSSEVDQAGPRPAPGSRGQVAMSWALQSKACWVISREMRISSIRRSRSARWAESTSCRSARRSRAARRSARGSSRRTCCAG